METQKQLDERLAKIQGEMQEFKAWLEGRKIYEYMRGEIDKMRIFEEVIKQLEEREL